jgi:hypothetical protein
MKWKAATEGAKREEEYDFAKTAAVHGSLVLLGTRNASLQNFLLFVYCFLTIYSRYLKRVISKRDGCEYLKQVPSSDGSLEFI